MKISANAPKHGILIIAILILCCWTAVTNIGPQEINKSSDANVYMRMAYHIYHSHMVSETKSDSPHVTNRREPGFPFYLACMMKFSPKLAAVEFSKLTTPEGGLVLFRYCQIPILLGMALCSWVLTYLITKRCLYSHLAMLIVGSGHSLLLISTSMKREHFMALLVLIVAIFLFLSIKTKLKRYFVFLGLSLACLALTNAVFQYFIYFFVLYLLFLLKMKVFEKKQFIICLLLLFAGYFVPVGSWKMRNYNHFKRFYICDRAGEILAIRAEYNKMTADEYWGSFAWWTPDARFQQKAQKVMQEEGRWTNLHRSNPDGYYRTAKSLKNFRVEGEKFDNASQRGKAYQSRAMKEILSHPFKHIVTTIPFAWRGIFVEYGYIVLAPFTIMVRSVILIGILYFGSLFFWFIQSFREKRWDLFAITFLCMYLYGVNSFVSHSLPRYNQPLIPVLAVLLMVSLCSMISRKKDAKHTKKR